MKITAKYLIVLATLLLAHEVSLGQGQDGIRFRHFGKKDGLSQNSVFAIAQDGRGVMWFGTREGLNEFDGYHFKVYEHESQNENSLPSNDVRTLAWDHFRNCLWIGTMEGLGRFDFATGRFSRITSSDGSTFNEVRHILVDSFQRVWVGTSIGLHLLEKDASAFRPVKWFAGSKPEVKVIFEEAPVIWLGTAQGVFIFSKEQDLAQPPQAAQERYAELAPLASLHIKTIDRRQPGEYWFGTQADGIWRWQRSAGKLTQFRNRSDDPNSLSHDNIRSVAVASDGTLWVGTFVGLNRFLPEKDGFQRILSDDFNREGLRNSSVRSVFADNRDNLWVGTYYGGLHYLNDEFCRFRIYQHQAGINSLSFDVVSSFAEAPNGDLWVGTEGGGLNFLDQKTGQFRFRRAGGSLKGDNVKSLLLDGQTLYIGTFQHGLHSLNTQTGTIRHFGYQPNNPASISDDNVYALLKADDTLWVGTYGGGLNKMDLKTGRFTHFRHDAQDARSLSSDQVRTLAKGPGGQLWAGTDEGLNRAARLPDGQLAFEHFLPDIKVYATFFRGENLWVGSLGQGLFRLKPSDGSTEQFTTADGLPGNSVLGILPDKTGHLWLSTNNGISRFNPEERIFINYSHIDGLENLEFNYNAYYSTRSGDLLFGGTHGFTRFRPEQLQPSSDLPPVIFTGLTAFNRPIEVGGQDGLLERPLNETEAITFRYGNANFTLHFAAVDFTNPLGNRFAYRMLGLNEDWTYTTGKPEATYTLQREGSYVFQMKAANKDGVWNPEIKELKVKVLPPIARTWWAYLLYILVSASAIAAIVRFVRLRQSYRLEHLEKEQQAAMHQMKLHFFTNVAHEFRTPLTLIIGPLEDLLQSQATSQDSTIRRRLGTIYNNAQRMLDLVNQLLTFRKMEEGYEPMQVQLTDLATFLQPICDSFADHAAMRNIRYLLLKNPEPAEAWIDREKLNKVFFNLLSNAFKFAPDGGVVEVSLRQNDSEVIVSVRDNGPGIEPALQEQVFQRFYEKTPGQSASLIKGMGIGLSLSRQLVELHHGRLTLESQPGEGANFTVYLPKGKAHFQPEALLVDTEKVAETALPVVPLNLPVEPEKVMANSNGRQPLLLIVEDNLELQAFIRSIFADEYRTATASDGAEGLAKANELNPELILSDVMMPKMDGFELCQRLKTDLATSHIPVLLITARTTLDDRLEGLETGADDYISKPFHPDELRLKVRNRLAQRQRLREQFGQSRIFAPKEVAVTSADEEFLEKLVELVEQNISNPNFNIEQFAQELAVSRALLFTKIKALTNSTPKNFLKSFRLKRAAQLLQTGKLNVSEVAYQVGFNEPKYFSKVFQKEFGCSPSQFKEV
ncbi:MAG: response regulator [Lewinellaceae bacterium]|nr:response regulator [Lewinellaceae bacterium]